MAQAVRRRPVTAGLGFSPSPIHVKFAVSKGTLGHVFLLALCVSPVLIIPAISTIITRTILHSIQCLGYGLEGSSLGQENFPFT
jgi:hypothetical protein